MKAVQKAAVAKQVRLDEESLQRLKEAEAKDKVGETQRKTTPLGVILEKLMVNPNFPLA